MSGFDALSQKQNQIRLTEVFNLAEPCEASSLSKPIDEAACTICKHSSGVKTSSMTKAPATPVTSSLEGVRRDEMGVKEMVLGDEA